MTGVARNTKLAASRGRRLMGDAGCGCGMEGLLNMAELDEGKDDK
jgi:hypothetical protein